MCEVSPWPQGYDTESSRTTGRPRHDAEFSPLWSSNTGHQCPDTIVGMPRTLFSSQDLLLPCNAITKRVSCNRLQTSLTKGPTEQFSFAFLLTPPRRQNYPLAWRPQIVHFSSSLGLEGDLFPVYGWQQTPELPSSTPTFLWCPRTLSSPLLPLQLPKFSGFKSKCLRFQHLQEPQV